MDVWISVLCIYKSCNGCHKLFEYICPWHFSLRTIVIIGILRVTSSIVLWRWSVKHTTGTRSYFYWIRCHTRITHIITETLFLYCSIIMDLNTPLKHLWVLKLCVAFFFLIVCWPLNFQYLCMENQLSGVNISYSDQIDRHKTWSQNSHKQQSKVKTTIGQRKTITNAKTHEKLS